jgi:small conductance mechanosensitive channel
VERFVESLVLGFESIVQSLGEWVSDHFVNILVIIVGAWAVKRFGMGIANRILNRTVRQSLYHTKSDREKRINTLSSLVHAVINVGVYIIAVILIIGEINPTYTAALFTGAGLIGVALGFGAKDLINDFINGIFIIVENQYRVGDVVELAGVSGIVEDITIRTTVLRDLDGNRHHIPNGSIGTTSNMTLGFSRVNMDITVGYDTDLDKLEKIINKQGDDMAASEDFKHKILKAPHFLRVDGFGDNGIVVKILAETTTGDQWELKGELFKRLKVALESNNIEIPYQHVVIHQHKSSQR